MSDGQSGRIPDRFIESLIAQTDLVTLIQEKVKLKKAGNNFSGCCPFHQEKTPSFTVSPMKQFYHCFGCGAHGNAIGFLMAHDALSFVDAIEVLSARLGLTVPRDMRAAAKQKEKADLSHILDAVSAFYQAQLKIHPQGQQAIAYLKKRGLTGTIAKRFGVGFAPAGWTHLVDQFKADPHAFHILEHTGLVKKHSEGRYFDLFRSRILFPIRDRKGAVVGFGGRTIGNDTPKYLNSPESTLFHKSYCLYGLYEALQARQQWDFILVVEGYLDVIACVQQGVEGVVATLGTAITQHHLTQLFHVTDHIVFCLDGDKAGQQAAWKALQGVLPLMQQGRQVRFAFLPTGEDPDTYIRSHGKADFQALIANSSSLSDYFFNSLAQDQDLTSLDNRAQIAEKARGLIAQLPDGVFKEMMFEQLARLLASSPQVMRGEKARRYPYQHSKQFTQKILRTPPPKPSGPAYLACAILLREPALIGLVNQMDPDLSLYDALSNSHQPGCEVLIQLLTCLRSEPHLSSVALREKLPPLNKSQELALSAGEKKAAYIPELGLGVELQGTLERLLVIGQELLAQKLIQKAKVSELTQEEKEQLKEILQKRESK